MNLQAAVDISDSVIIRPAVRSDIKQIVELGRLMHAASRYQNLTFSPVKVSDTHSAILKGAGCVFVAEKYGQVISSIAGYLAPTWFGVDQTLTELCLFFDPSQRNEEVMSLLIKSFVEFGRQHNCRLIQAGVVAGIEQAGTEQLYQNLGGQNHGSLYEFGGN